MNANDSLDRLLDALEHPDHYTEEELQSLLRDEETRAGYQLLADAASAYRRARTAPELSAETLDDEWRRLTGRGPIAATAADKTGEGVVPMRRRWHMAAVGGAVLCVSGLAWAAIHIARHTPPHPLPKAPAAVACLDSAATPPSAAPDTALLPQPAAAPRHQFDNARLGDIVQKMAEYYRLRTVCHNDEAAQLRLHYLWDGGQPVEKAVETLNRFEKVNLTFADSTITIN